MFKTKCEVKEGEVMYFKGKETIPVDSTDVDYEVQQESFFYYLFGVQELACNMVVTLPDFTPHLFIPKFDFIYKIWMTTFDLEDAKKTYPDFEIHYNDELETFVKQHGKRQVYINKGVNSDSGLSTLVPTHDWFADLNINVTDLHNVLSESRSIKNPLEIEML